MTVSSCCRLVPAPTSPLGRTLDRFFVPLLPDTISEMTVAISETLNL